MTKPPPAQRKNTFEDSDFALVLEEIEEMNAEIETIMATARGKVSAVKTRQKNRKTIARQELKIPTDVLNAVLKQRGLERQLAKISAGIPDDQVELYLDSSGQFSLFALVKGDPAKTSAQIAAERRLAEINAITEKEQEEGAAALNELAKVH